MKMLRLLQSADMADWMLIPSVTDPAKVHVTPGRHAEYAVADQAALALFLALLLAAAVATEMRALLAYRTKNSNRLFVFVGWRRLGRVVLLGGLLPVAAYAFYVWLVPADRHFNLLITHARLFVEYAFLAAVIIMLLRRLGDAAVRQRGVELGLSIPKPSSRALDIVGLLLLLATIVYEFIWYIQAASLPPGRRYMPWSVNVAGYVLAGLLLVYAVTRLVPVTLRQFCKNILSWAGIRSLVGRILLAVAAVLAALVAMLNAPSDHTTAYWVTIGIIAVILLAWLAWHAHGRTPPSPDTALRPAGLLPIILALALILGLGGGGFLRWREARAVAQMPSIASRMLNEVADSRYQPLKERLSRE